VVVNTPYELVDDYMLTFVPYCYSYYLCGESTDVGSTDVPVNTNYVFFVTNDPNGTDPAQASQPVTVPVTVEYDPCGYSEEGVEAAC
jgi:hypothetical protein